MHTFSATWNCGGVRAYCHRRGADFDTLRGVHARLIERASGAGGALLPRRTGLARVGARSFTIRGRNSALDLNLPGNLDHILGIQIESIDDLYRVSVQKRKQRQSPAVAGIAPCRLCTMRSRVPTNIALSKSIAASSPRALSSARRRSGNLEESETRHQMPQAFADVVDDRAGRAGNARRIFEYHTERNGIAAAELRRNGHGP